MQNDHTLLEEARKVLGLGGKSPDGLEGTFLKEVFDEVKQESDYINILDWMAIPPPAPTTQDHDQVDGGNVEEGSEQAGPDPQIRLRTYSSSSTRQRFRQPRTNAGLQKQYFSAAQGAGGKRQPGMTYAGALDHRRMERLEAMKGRVFQRTVSECSQGTAIKASKANNEKNVSHNPSPV